MAKIFKTDFQMSVVKHLQCLPDFQEELNFSGKSSIFEMIQVGETISSLLIQSLEIESSKIKKPSFKNKRLKSRI